MAIFIYRKKNDQVGEAKYEAGRTALEDLVCLHWGGVDGFDGRIQEIAIYPNGVRTANRFLPHTHLVLFPV